MSPSLPTIATFCNTIITLIKIDIVDVVHKKTTTEKQKKKLQVTLNKNYTVHTQLRIKDASCELIGSISKNNTIQQHY